MKIRMFIAQIVLWFFVFSSSIQMGGSVYEMFVVNPLWFGSPPESVTKWNPDPQFAIEPSKFWAAAVPLYMLTTLTILITAWFMPSQRRKWALIAGVCTLTVILSTALFFVPILRETIMSRGAGLSDEQIITKVNLWVNWNWLRMAVVFIGWLAGIHALSLNPQSGVSSKQAI
jgi:Na+/melibiose symporter-like transporter